MATVSPLLVVLLLLLMTYCFAGSPSEQCSEPQTSDVKFSMTSYRNRTGHWVAEIRLEHGGETWKPGSDEHDTERWRVDVDQITARCGDRHSVQLVATVTGHVSAPPPKGRPGYEFFPGVGYYKFHKEGRTWDEARKVCQEEGGHLVIINSEEEDEVLKQLFSRVPKLEGVQHNDFVFIGFHDRFVEGEQVTIFGQPVQSTGFTRWTGPGQPDNAGGIEHCGSVHRNGGLNDITCAWKLGFICEQKL